MKKIFILIAILAIHTACNKNDTKPGLIGRWKEYESYISPGDITTWKPVKNGNTLILNSNGKYVIFNVDGKNINSGSFIANDSVILFKIDTSVNQSPLANIQAPYTIKNNMLEMWYIGCIEGCGFRYKKTF